MADYQLMLILYILLGALAAMIYGLKKIFNMERKILQIDQNILMLDKKISSAIGKKRR